MLNDAFTKPLNLEFLCNLGALFFLQTLQKDLEIMKNGKIFRFKGDLGKLHQKKCVYRQL